MLQDAPEDHDVKLPFRPQSTSEFATAYIKSKLILNCFCHTHAVFDGLHFPARSVRRTKEIACSCPDLEQFAWFRIPSQPLDTARRRNVLFGRFGDMIGRKYTFLVTMSLMGIGTFFIGVLPGYASWGILAPIVLIALRLVQGLALGGEYGGAAIYVAEHAPPNKRGYYTAWIQTTATLGLFMALLLILGIRTAMGEAAFGDWGWRIPFLLSAVLLAVSIWIRLKLAESPLFKRMVDEGKQSKRP